MKTERRTNGTRVALRIRKRDKQPVITGIAAVYYDGTDRTEYQLWENTVERIMPGAFKRAMGEDDVRGLFNHDPTLILGRNTADTLKLKSTKSGLQYQIEPADTTVSKDVQVHLQRGDVSGSSFSFRITDERWREEGKDAEKRTIREIRGVELFDVGPVTFPAYDATSAEFNATSGNEAARASHDAWRAEAEAEAAEAGTEAALRKRRIIAKNRRAQLMGLH